MGSQVSSLVGKGPKPMDISYMKPLGEIDPNAGESPVYRHAKHTHFDDFVTSPLPEIKTL